MSKHGLDNPPKEIKIRISGLKTRNVILTMERNMVKVRRRSGYGLGMAISSNLGGCPVERLAHSRGIKKPFFLGGTHWGKEIRQRTKKRNSFQTSLGRGGSEVRPGKGSLWVTIRKGVEGGAKTLNWTTIISKEFKDRVVGRDWAEKRLGIQKGYTLARRGGGGKDEKNPNMTLEAKNEGGKK